MCHNKCPPQRCYWRNLSKRSISNETYYENEQYGEPFSVGRYNFTLPRAGEQPVIASDNNSTGVISESLSLFQALEVRHSDDTEEDYDEAASLSRYDHPNSEFVHSRLAKKRGRKGDALRYLGKYRWTLETVLTACSRFLWGIMFTEEASLLEFSSGVSPWVPPEILKI